MAHSTELRHAVWQEPALSANITLHLSPLARPSGKEQRQRAKSVGYIRPTIKEISDYGNT
jgi:hypothetical protein